MSIKWIYRQETHCKRDLRCYVDIQNLTVYFYLHKRITFISFNSQSKLSERDFIACAFVIDKLSRKLMATEKYSINNISHWFTI